MFYPYKYRSSDEMSELKEQESKMRLYLSTVEAQIHKFEALKKTLQIREDEIREAIATHSFSPAPISLKPNNTYDGDVYADIQQHLLELNKLKNYISIKLKEIIREEELLSILKSKFGESIDFEKQSRGDFEIVYSDKHVIDAFEHLSNGKEKIKMIKDSLSEMNDEAE